MKILLFVGIVLTLIYTVSPQSAQPISQTTVYTAKEGDTLDINCNATSTHNNEIYWEKNVSHSTFRQNGSHLNFVNITRDSAGVYVCYSKNLTTGSVNASVVRSIDIDVLYAPEPDPKAGIQYTVQTRPGFDCSLLMKNLGNPHPTYKWTHNGAMVSHKDFRGVLSIAKITDVKIKDFGNYTLMMNNVVGTYVTHYLIEPYGPPEAPSSFRYFDLTTSSVTLQWTSGYDMGKIQHFIVYQWVGYAYAPISGRIYENTTTHGVGNVVSYVVRDLKPNTFYKMKVASQIDDGREVYYESPIEFTTKSKEVIIPRVEKVIEGHNLLVVCNATQTADQEVFWVKNDSESHFLKNGTKLRFININRNSSGVYMCYLRDTKSSSNGTVMELVDVDVLYPAEIAQFSIKNTTVRENKTLTISCYVTGNPAPIWSIRNNYTKKQVVAGDKSEKTMLIYGPMDCEDTGFWMCTGYNYLNHGKNATRGENLTVLCAPKPKRGANEYRVKGFLGMPIYLIMNSLGYPYPTYTWSHNGRVLPSNMHVDLDWMSLLNLTRLKVEDFGKYSLKMTNNLGTYTADYELVASGHPEPPTGLRASDVTPDSVRLQWISGFDMGSQQHFVVLKWIGNSFIQISERIYDHSTNHGVGDRFDYVVKGLSPSTSYKLGIAAENKSGKVVFCKTTVEFTTQYAPPTPEPRTVNTKALAIGCSVGGLALLGFVAFLVYMKKYRNMNVAYDIMKKPIKS